MADASYALSDTDIQQAIGVKPTLYYPDLFKVDNINQILDKKGRAVVLYLTTSLTNGHWVGLIKKGKTIEYFDPYGHYKPDGESRWLTKNKQHQLHEDTHRLTELLNKSGYEVTVNPFPYQGHQQGNNECGRHTVSRLYYYKMSEPEYMEMIRRSGMTPDQFALQTSYSLLGK
jgi:hypothetical protein